MLGVNCESGVGDAVAFERLEAERVECGGPRAGVDLRLDAADTQIGERHPLAPANDCAFHASFPVGQGGPP